MTSETPVEQRVERLIEQTLFGPIDLTIRAVEGLPTAIDRVRHELLAARFVGKLAVDQGVLELRRLIEGSGRPDAPQRSRAAPAPTEPARSTGDEGLDEADGRGSPDVPDAAQLALPDYEHLPASHVVAKLAGLRQAERDAIERFESANRHRRTVLGKLEQLRER